GIVIEHAGHAPARKRLQVGNLGDYGQGRIPEAVVEDPGSFPLFKESRKDPSLWFCAISDGRWFSPRLDVLLMTGAAVLSTAVATQFLFSSIRSMSAFGSP